MYLGYDVKYVYHIDRTTQPKVIIREDYFNMLESKAEVLDELKKYLDIETGIDWGNTYIVKIGEESYPISPGLYELLNKVGL